MNNGSAPCGNIRRCIAILGGSFDPVHKGHVALAEFFASRLAPDELRIMPAGNPWQKPPLGASAEQRVAMLELAFAPCNLPLVIDRREIEASAPLVPGGAPRPTYTVDTLRSLREEFGPQVALVFLIGADQLERLQSWRQWRQVFDYAHLCIASRPGFTLDMAKLDGEVADECTARAAPGSGLRRQAHGLVCLLPGLEEEVSATQVRAALARGEKPDSLIPPLVLDYIEQHHLYKN